MADVTRLRKGPYPTPRPSGEELTMEPIKLGVKTRVALVGLGALAAVAATGVLGSRLFSEPPTAEQIKNAPTDTRPQDYNPDEANPSGIPHSGGN
jgi:hypothetical protein